MLLTIIISMIIIGFILLMLIIHLVTKDEIARELALAGEKNESVPNALDTPSDQKTEEVTS